MEVVKAMESLIGDFTMWLCGKHSHIYYTKEENETRKIKFVSDRYEVYKKFT